MAVPTSDGDGTSYEAAYGRRDVTQPAPMTLDSVFWIASMTKAVTGAAAMQLVEQGKLKLEQEIQDLGLDRHVQRAGRLIADDQPRLYSQRPSDGDPLPLASGEFVWISRLRGRIEPDFGEQVADG